MRLLIALSLSAASLLLGQPALGQPAGHAPPNLNAAVDELIAADRSFARASAATDIISGLSAMFDEKVIVPVPGKVLQNKAEVLAAMRANPANVNAKASWSVIKAGVSADGQQGFTLGYVTVEDLGKPAPRLSKYLAYWARHSDGWRVIAYKREPRPAGEVSLKMMQSSVPSKAIPPADVQSVKKMEEELVEAEGRFATMARESGMGTAIGKYAAPDSISLGSAPEVTVGVEEMARVNLPSVARWSADGARVAASGDLGFTWGISRLDSPPPGQQQTVFPFFAVWRRAESGGWQVIAR